MIDRLYQWKLNDRHRYLFPGIPDISFQDLRRILYTFDSTFSTPFPRSLCVPEKEKWWDACDPAQTTLRATAITSLYQSRVAPSQYLVHVLRGQPKAVRLDLENQVAVAVPGGVHCIDGCCLYKADLERPTWSDLSQKGRYYFRQCCP